ncbi:phosphate ABC transporter permease subunit PstC [Geminisphaera colitermitum]|uniref:phosphate ABC transporter permease subunit PstC n=1 Tax=Geminisphaera colitermitum TaxID=1148786 RepID=UPI0005B932A0|nr:phosphate ABC transporter permease subunit PstC [Geminisphaera colitermitum]
MSPPPPPPVAVPRAFDICKPRTRLFGLTLDECIQGFFGGNAIMAVVVLALITLFLFREGAEFFTQNRDNLRIYRQAGLEYVDEMRAVEHAHTALTRYLNDVRMQAVRELSTPTSTRTALSLADINTRLAPFDDFASRFSDTIDPVRSVTSDLVDVATATKTRYLTNADRITEREQLIAAGRHDEAAAIKIETIDFAAESAHLTAALPAFKDATAELATRLREVVASPPSMSSPALDQRIQRLATLTSQYLDGIPAILQNLEAWNVAAPIPAWKSIVTFITGRQWLTASFWQDWYGILPLFTGSLLVSAIALVLAVPFGVGAAIYINQIATLREQRIVKPAIEFISAIPSVVLGFFGIAVLGQLLRTLSGVTWLDWVPGFPFSERLNALTAGCLLGLIAVPTIFTLAEDALNNVPRAFKEASFALGATRLQTILRIIVPASLSGIISATLLGFGRVIGETMVVLLCAGNRIAIPDFTSGLGVVTQPVHTMTGIIAQEMGEVVRGSIHYRALFVVGIVLFFLALLINFLAQKIVRKYRISIG